MNIKKDSFSNIALIKVSEKGYSILYKDDTKSQVVGELNNENVELFITSKVPVIDLRGMSQEKLREVIQTTPIASIYPDKPPYSPMSKAPVELSASIFKEHGAKILNISEITIPKDIIKKASNKENVLFNEIIEGKYLNSMKPINDSINNIFDINSIEHSKSMNNLIKAGKIISEMHTKAENESIKILSDYNKIPGNEKLKLKKGKGMDVLGEHLVQKSESEALGHILNIFLYESLISKENNFSEKKHFDRIMNSISNIDIMFSMKKDKISDDLFLLDASKSIIKKTISIIENSIENKNSISDDLST